MEFTGGRSPAAVGTASSSASTDWQSIPNGRKTPRTSPSIVFETLARFIDNNLPMTTQLMRIFLQQNQPV
ncbi:MAG: hypothetical protein BVN28_13290 [Nitrospira sp. ST-bin4]|nr:MAG: hypothetical protein BVN28_13290 [Nitrospira sp. ST-bin4]